MPAFWDTPAAPWLSILVIHIRSQVKIRQRQSNKYSENCQKFKFLNSARNFTGDMPSEFAWYRYEMDTTRTLGATERAQNAGRTDGRMEWNQNIPCSTIKRKINMVCKVDTERMAICMFLFLPINVLSYQRHDVLNQRHIVCLFKSLFRLISIENSVTAS